MDHDLGNFLLHGPFCVLYIHILLLLLMTATDGGKPLGKLYPSLYTMVLRVFMGVMSLLSVSLMVTFI